MEQSIPDDWDGAFCTYAICWPDSPQWHIILRGLLTMPRQGRFWAASSGSILDVQAVTHAMEDYNFDLRSLVLACTDDQFNELIAAINAISITGGGTTIVNCYSTGSGSGGSRGTGEIEAPENPYDPVATPGVPPAGFDDMDQFRGQKCDAAWTIVRELIADLKSLSAWTYGGSSIPAIVSIMVGVLITPLPHDDIVGVIAYLIYTTFQYTFLLQTSVIMNEFRAEIVCDLATAPTVATAELRLKAKINELLDRETIWIQGEKNFVNGAVEWFIGNDSINRMFENIYVPDGEDDCQNCGCDDTFSVKFNFDDDILGWALNPGVTFDAVQNYNNITGQWVLDWDGVGALRMTVGGGVTNTRATAYVPVSHVIQPNDAFYVQLAVSNSTITFNWFLATPDGTVFIAGGFGTGAGATLSQSLADFIGVEVGYIGLFCARAASGGYAVTFPYVWISCVAP